MAIAKVDVQTVAAGYRASKVNGSNVLNEANETIGKIDDLLVIRDGKEPYAVLSIGGFLGMGTHLVVVRYDSLRFDPDNKIVLPGGTKEGLTMLPAFEYAKQFFIFDRRFISPGHDDRKMSVRNSVTGTACGVLAMQRRLRHEHYSYHHFADSDFRRGRWVLCPWSLWDCGARRRPGGCFDRPYRALARRRDRCLRTAHVRRDDTGQTNCGAA